jgi:hypothetical protein
MLQLKMVQMCEIMDITATFNPATCTGVPVTGHRDPLGCEMLRLGSQMVVRLSALYTGRQSFIPRRIAGTHLTPGPNCGWKVTQLKNPTTTSGIKPVTF